MVLLRERRFAVAKIGKFRAATGEEHGVGRGSHGPSPLDCGG